MNDTLKLETVPEVADFVARVRARLAGLSDEEREELVGGLEADLTELVADGGSVAELGDPRAYADELRAAAGLDSARTSRLPGVRRPRRPVRQVVEDAFGRAGASWDSLVSRPRVAPAWEVTAVLRPAWWVLRAWVAVQLLDQLTGPWEYATLVPRFGDPLTGPLLLLAAVLGSVLLGLRRLWPASASPRSLLARTVLLALNAFAVLMLLVTLENFPSSRFINDASHPAASGMYGPMRFPGLMNDGRAVTNVFAYDAQGNPLTGVQLYDQRGEPLEVAHDRIGRVRTPEGPAVLYPWENGEKNLWHVYPLPVRQQPGWNWAPKEGAWGSERPPYLPQPPLAVVPPASVPLVTDPEPEPAGGVSEDPAGAGSTEDGAPQGTGRDSEKPRGR